MRGSVSTGRCSSVSPAGTNTSSASAAPPKRIKIQIAVRQSRSGARCPTIVVACSKAAVLAFHISALDRADDGWLEEMLSHRAGMPNPAKKYSRKGVRVQLQSFVTQG